MRYKYIWDGKAWNENTTTAVSAVNSHQGTCFSWTSLKGTKQALKERSRGQDHSLSREQK